MIYIPLRTLLLSVFFFFYFLNTVVAANSKLITQLQLFDNDTTFRYLYFYNKDGVKVLETCAYQKDSVWVNKSQTEWMIHNAYESRQTERVWKANKWVEKYIIVFEGLEAVKYEKHYNGSVDENNLVKLIESKHDLGKIISKKIFSKSISGMLLTDSIFYKYKNDQLLFSETKSYFPDRSFEIHKDSFSYYTDNKLYQHTYFVKHDAITWRNVSQTTWYYRPGNAEISSQRMKKWNAELQVWENMQMHSFIYNRNNLLVEEKYYAWGKMIWQESVRFVFDYYADGLLSMKSLYIPIYNQWRNFSNINYGEINFDDQKEILSVLGFWGGTKNEAVSADIPFSFNDEIIIKKAKRLKLLYSEFTDISEVKVRDVDNILIYPNPSSGVYYFDQQSYQLKSWKIYNINGSKVLQSENNFSSGVIDLTNLPKGIYMLRAIANDKIMTQKLIKN